MSPYPNPAYWQFVYVIGYDEGAQKIGFSNDPEQRARSLRKKAKPPLKVHFAKQVQPAEAPGIEALAHRTLQDKALGGETFDVSITVAIATVESAAEKYAAGERAPRKREADPSRVVSVALPEDTLRRLTDWTAGPARSEFGKILSQPAAIRMLVDEALAARAKSKPSD